MNGNFKIKRLAYYLASFFKILSEVKAYHLPKLFLFVLLYPFNKKPLKIKLKKLNLSYRLFSLLDLLVLKEVVLDEEYEKELVIEPSDKIIVDVGAGFGDFAILAAKKYPWTKIFAIEPDPLYFKLLKENIKRNQVENILPFVKFVFSLEDIFVLDERIKKIDFLKMDCEGCEFVIFEKAERESLKKIKKIVLEYHLKEKRRISDLVKVLGKNGFVVKTRKRKEVPGIGFLWAERF